MSSTTSSELYTPYSPIEPIDWLALQEEYRKLFVKLSPDEWRRMYLQDFTVIDDISERE